MDMILGSGSSSRKRILAELGFSFTVMTADIDEKTIRDTEPMRLVEKLARAKAQAILPHIQNPSLLITADQVVACNGRILEKPRDAEEARAFLRLYPTHAPLIVNGLCVTNTQTGQAAFGTDTTRVVFSLIPDHAIEAMILEGRIFHAAGGFYAEDPMFAPYLISMEGTPDSCSGLPKKLLTKLLEAVH